MQQGQTWTGISDERNYNGTGVGDTAIRDGGGRSCGKTFSTTDVGLARQRRAVLLYGSPDFSIAPVGRHVIRDSGKKNISRRGDYFHAARGEAGGGRRG